MKSLIIKCLKVLIFFLILSTCQSNSNGSNRECPLGEPVPIYSSDYNFVKSHQFSKEGQNSTEEIIFADDLHLTISQSGCERIRQEYAFLLEREKGEKTDSIWVTESAHLFSQLAAYEEKFYSFNQWANKINQHKSEIKLTEPFEVAPKMYIQIDPIKDSKATLLRIILFEE